METIKKVILVIEDNDGLNLLITEKVDEMGYNTVSVHSGNEALVWLSTNVPYLIILDYSLPDMNGFDLILNYKSSTQSIAPFIVSTGQGDEAIAVSMMKLGAKDYLVKNRHFLDKLPEVLKRIENEIENENKRKWTEKALKESEANLAEAQRITKTGSWVWNLETNQVTWSKEMYRVYDINEDEFTNKPEELLKIIHPDDLETFTNDMNTNLQSIDTPPLEYRIFHKDGSIHYIYAEGRTEINELGKQIKIGIARDITEQKLAQQQLIESEQKYREMADFLPVGLFETDLNGTLTFANQTVIKWLEYSSEYFMNTTNIVNFVIDEECEKAMERSKRVMTENKHAIGEYTLKRKSGNTFPVIISSIAITKNNKVSGLRGTIVDITDRKKAEQALMHSHELMKYIIEHMHGGLAVFDLNMNYTYVSQQYLNDYKIEEKNIIGQNHYKVFPDISERWKIIHQKALSGEVCNSEKDIFERANGTTQWNRWECRPWYNENNTIGGIILYTEVITERVLLEEALRENERQVKNLFDNAADAIFVADTNTGILLDANKAAEKLLKKSIPEIIGAHQSTLHLAASEKNQEESFIQHKNEIDMAIPTSPIENEVVCSDGSLVPVEILASKVFYNGKDCLLGTFRDITERKKNQEALLNERLLLRTLIDNIPDGIYLKDLNSRKIITNLADAKNIGLKSETDVLGKTDFELFPKEIAEKFYADDQSVLQTGNSILNKEEFLFDENGQKRWLLSSKLPLYNQAGQVTGLIGIGRDITPQKLEESITMAFNKIYDFSFYATYDQLLQKTIDEIESLTQSSIGFMHFVEPDQVTLSLQMWSTNTLLKMCTAEAKGSHYSIDKAGIWVDCVHSRSPIIHNNYAEQPHKKGLPEGHAPIIRELVVPIFRNEKIVAIIGVGNKESDYNQTDVQTATKLANLVWEITERNKVKEELVNSEKTHREMIANISDVIAIIGSDGLIKYKSPNIVNWFGWLPEDLIGTDAWHTVHPDDLDRIQNEFYNLLENENSTKTVEYRYKCKNGSYKTIELTAVNLSHDPVIDGVLMNYKDITERKKAEETLKELNLFNLQVINSAEQGIIVYDRNMTCLAWNPFMEKLSGYAASDVLGKNPAQLFSFLKEAGISDSIEKAFNGEPAYSNDILFNFPSTKKSVWSYYSIAPLLNTQNKIIGVIIVVIDITKRKLAEIEALETKTRLQKAQSIARVGNWEIDLATNKIWASDEAFKIYGIENMDHNLPLELVQQAPLPEYRPILDNALQQLITKNEPYDLEFQINQNNSKDCLSIHSIAELVRDEYGKPKRVIGVIQDITNQKKMENELRILSNAIEQNPASIVITNTKGDIEYVNPKFVQLTGYSNQEALGNNPRILKTDTTSAEEYLNLWNTISRGNIWKGEFCNKKKDGSHYWESAIISPVFNTFGKITHYVAVKEDITEKKETDRKIMSAIIEGEERERNRFSRELHDGLGPLLSSIKLYFQWISKMDDPEKKNFLTGKGNHNIDEAIITLREISNNLSPQSLSTFGLVLALQNYIEGLNQMNKVHIVLKSDTEQRFNKNIEITLYRVTLELINNSLKHANATEIHINLHPNPLAQTLQLTYNENGLGFDLEKTMAKPKGRGLMNIQYRINSINGKIKMNSSPGKGLEVVIEVPITVEE